MSLRTVIVTTDNAGDFTWERETFATVHAVSIDLGTLESPDVTVSDGVNDFDILTVTSVSSDAVYQPTSPLMEGTFPAVVMGSLKLTIENGGAMKSGRVTFLLQR